MKFKKILTSILIESKTSEKAIQKLKNLGINDNNAKALGNIAGSIYRLLAFRILEKYEKEYADLESRYDMSKTDISNDLKKRFQLINNENAFISERNRVRSIVDWYRVGLGGVIKPYENFTFNELFDESERWHESLGIGESKIDYKETNDIILDFRKNGVGYYWADLGTTNCPDEAERMGHCGSSRGNIYSLRHYKKIENNHTLNKSYLTASVDGSGTLLQLKGPKNSKPSNDSHSLILPLLYHHIDNGDYNGYLINHIGYEYDSTRDFKISDLTEGEVKKLYSDRPELFTGRQEKKLLKSLGLVDPVQYDSTFTLTIHPKYADDYIRGEMSNIVYEILMSDTYQYWDNAQYAEWRYGVEELSEENEQKIVEILKRKNEAEHYLGKFDSGMNLKDMIEEYDNEDEIKNSLRWSINDAEAQDYENYLYNELKSVFEEYGQVISMNDEGVVIKIDLEVLISANDIDDETMDDMIERCGDDTADAECLFTELLGDGYIEKPRFDVDERWYPSMDKNSFNEILNDRLSEI